MRYRMSVKTGERISLLAFGAMRLPVINGVFSEIDEPKAIEMIRKAIDSGVNYIDTAYPYHNGNSEILVGKALRDGYRGRVILADKYPTWLTNASSNLSAILSEQLNRLKVDSIDNYLIHSLNKPTWKLARDHGIIPAVEKEREAGRVKYVGFSFHDALPLFKEIVDAYDWDFCQIQLNYADENFQAGVEGLRYAAEKGISVIVMEPLKGGKLTDSIPASIQRIWEESGTELSPAEWAFRWVAAFPEVVTVLSGMSTMEQVEENIRIFSEMPDNPLTEEDRSLIKRVKDEYERLIPYACTECRYCLPCTVKLRIPHVIEDLNDWAMYKNPKSIESYKMWTPKEQYPSNCTKCGACEEKCPQGLPIQRIMDEAAGIFER